MTEFRPDEWISAYLDGELSAEEQERVEQLLATDPQARQMLDEWKALSGTLQAMPLRKAGVDLSAAVLRQAERAMLADPARAKLAVAARPADSVHIEPQRARRPFRPGVRSWAWAGLAVAAALLLMVIDRSPPDVKEVAQGRVGVPRDAATLESNEAPARKAPLMKNVADQAAAKKVSGVGADRIAANKTVDERAGKAEEYDGKLAAKQEIARESEAAARADSFTARDALAKGQSDLRRKSASPQSEAATAAPAAPGPPAASSARSALAQSPERETDKNGLQNLKQQSLKELLRDRHPAKNRRAAARDDLLVVRVDVAPDALRSGTFHDILARQEIAWEEEQVRAPAEQADEALAEDSQLNEPQAEGEQPAESTPPGEETKRSNAAHRALDSDDASQRDVELVYVEASVAQVERAIADLAAQTDAYLAVTVDPAPGVADQQPLADYSRGSDGAKADDRPTGGGQAGGRGAGRRESGAPQPGFARALRLRSDADTIPAAERRWAREKAKDAAGESSDSVRALFVFRLAPHQAGPAVDAKPAGKAEPAGPPEPEEE